MQMSSTDPERIVGSWLRSQERGINAFAEDICVGTRTGSERASNQDRALVARFGSARWGMVELYVVCDGMGGMVDGATCAEASITRFVLTVSRCLASGLTVGQALLDAVMSANRAVFELVAGKGGSTLAAVAISHAGIMACSVGDTRIFLVRGDGGTTQLTRDDTMNAALDAIGQKPVERVPEHDRLVQFVGMGGDLQPHVFPVAELERSRFLVLATDGAYRLNGDLLLGVFRHARTTKQVVDRALHVADWVGGADDATLVAVGRPSVLPRSGADSESLMRLWGPSSQQLALWLPGRETQRQLPLREATAEAPIRKQQPAQATKKGSPARGKKPPRSPKVRPQQRLPLQPAGELVIELGNGTSPPDSAGERSPAPPRGRAE